MKTAVHLALNLRVVAVRYVGKWDVPTVYVSLTVFWMSISTLVAVVITLPWNDRLPSAKTNGTPLSTVTAVGESRMATASPMTAAENETSLLVVGHLRLYESIWQPAYCSDCLPPRFFSMV